METRKQPSSFQVFDSKIIMLIIKEEEVPMQITKWSRGWADKVYISGFDNGLGYFTDSPIMVQVVDKTWEMTQAQKTIFQNLPLEAQVRLEKNYYSQNQSNAYNYLRVAGKTYRPIDFCEYFDQKRHEIEYENEPRSA